MHQKDSSAVGNGGHFSRTNSDYHHYLASYFHHIIPFKILERFSRENVGDDDNEMMNLSGAAKRGIYYYLFCRNLFGKMLNESPEFTFL